MQAPSKSTDSTVTAQGPEQSRLRKVKSAMQLRLPFWNNKGKDTAKEKKHELEATYTQSSAAPNMGYPYADYSSDMVDVLDTIGMYCRLTV